MKKIFFIVAVAAPFFLYSCAGNKTGQENADSVSADTTLPDVSASMPDTAVSNIVEVTGNDQMKYSATEIRVKAGELVTLTFKNVGSMPKVAMGHNFVVLNSGTDLEKFAMKAAVSQATEYIPADMKTAVLIHTKILGPGESETITFTVPKGEYEFVCTFPGHWAQMRGKLIAI